MKTQIACASFLFISCFSQLAVAGDVPVLVDHFDSIGDDGLPDGWQAWNPTKVEVEFSVNSKITASGGHSVRVNGGKSRHSKGALRRTFNDLKTGEYYKFIVRYTTRGISGINSRVFPVLKWSKKRRWRPLEPVAIDDGWLTAELVHKVPKDANGSLTLDLFSAWIPDGSVYWDSVEVHHVPNYTRPAARNVRVAVIDSRPGRPVTLMENCEFYCSAIANACRREKLDAICMTEVFNQLDVKDKTTAAVSLDGEYMARLRQVARDNSVNLIGSVKEDDDGVIFNTGFLINRNGELIDTYRKAQLAMTEVLFGEISQGDELKVMQADFGKIGILICWDYQFPEAARTLCLKGAEIIFVPIAGCGRHTEDGCTLGMELSGKVVALENRIPMVFSRWVASDPKRPSRIINSRAKVVAHSNEQSFISAQVELAAPIFHWGGSEFTREYFTSRRPELYGALSDDSLRIHTPDGPVLVPSPEDTKQSVAKD